MPPEPGGTASPLESWARALFGAFSSYGLACVILAFMLLLTWLGTMEQQVRSLHDVKKEFFHSFFLVYHPDGRVFGFEPWSFRPGIPLPGGMLLMILLFVNLLVGGVVRMRRSLKVCGIYITHLGIASLLVGGFVNFTYADEGFLRLWEGESSREFVSYTDWEISIKEKIDGDRIRRHIVPSRDLMDLSPTSRTFSSPSLPFDLLVTGWVGNSRPLPAGGKLEGKVIDGFFLRPLPPDPERGERNMPGCIVTLRPENREDRLVQAILWGGQRHPLSVRFGGRRYDLELRNETFQLPFEVRLDKFRRALHPGTGMARSFDSDVTVKALEGEEGVPDRKVRIWMNHPLRDRGFILFQSSWGPENAEPGRPLWSGFSVVRNPSDQWPAWSCLVISVGMLLHFGSKLLGYIRAESARRQA